MAKRKASKSKPEAIPTGAETGVGVVKLDPSGRVTEGRFAGYYRLPHGIYSRRSPEAREQEERERRARDQAKHERFRESCEKCRQLLADSNVRAYWLAQIQAVMETESTWQGPCGGAGLRYEWPRDKAKVYAVMAICVDTFSSIRILPDELRQTEFYKANENIWVWVQNDDFDLAAEFLSYIEADLKAEGQTEPLGTAKNRTNATGLQVKEPFGPADEPKVDVSGWQATVISLLWQHRDWPIQEVAKKVGKTRSALYADPDTKAAIQARSSGKRQSGSLPNGDKDPETGRLEAWRS